VNGRDSSVVRPLVSALTHPSGIHHIGS